MLQNAGVFNILTCKCASRHSGVAIFWHQTSNKWSVPVSFSTFWLTNMLRATAACHFWTSELPKWLRQCGVLCYSDLQMCFAPQPRAIFEHRNFQNRSESVVFCALWLANVLRATAACHFSPVCQNSYLRTRRFSQATFRTSGTTNHWKNTAIRDVPNIFHTCTFFQVTLHAGVSPFCWLDICCLFDTSTLLFNSAYCRKLDF